MASPSSTASRRNAAAKIATKAAGPGRPKDLGKRAAILEAAKRLFVEQGYQGVSMDQIAAAAGVSKLTVYSHFGDKETLFVEAVGAKCREMLPDDLFLPTPRGTLREQLVAIGRAFFALITSDEAIAIHRMVMNPDTDDRVRGLFWEAGPRRVQEAFAGFLQAKSAAGELQIEDLPLAASQYFSLLKGELHPLMMCGLCPRPGRAEVSRHIEATADFFLRAYAPR